MEEPGVRVVTGAEADEIRNLGEDLMNFFRQKGVSPPLAANAMVTVLATIIYDGLLPHLVAENLSNTVIGLRKTVAELQAKNDPPSRRQ